MVYARVEFGARLHGNAERRRQFEDKGTRKNLMNGRVRTYCMDARARDEETPDDALKRRSNTGMKKSAKTGITTAEGESGGEKVSRCNETSEF